MKKSICFLFTFTIIFFLAFLPEAKSQYKSEVLPDNSKISPDLILSKSLLFPNLSLLPVNPAPDNFGFLETKTTRSLLLIGKIFLNYKAEVPPSFKSFYPESVSDYSSGFHFYKNYGEYPILNN